MQIEIEGSHAISWSSWIGTMVAASKYFRLEDFLPEIKCEEVYHPWTPSCLASVWNVGQRSIIGSAQGFTPMYLIQLILSRHSINRKYLKQLAMNFFRSVLFGNLFATIATAGCCVFRRLLGKFYYSTFVFAPAVLGGLSIVVERQSRREIYTCAVISATSEYVIRQLVRAQKLQLTKFKLCLSFMLLNAAAMYLMRRDKTQKRSGAINFWFFTPPRAQQRYYLKRDGNYVCYHSGSCWRHALKESASYLVIGVAGQMVRLLVPQFRKLLSGPTKVLKNLCFWKNYTLGMFLALYVGTYHAVSCQLLRFYGRDMKVHAMAAGFLAGPAFLIDPTLNKVTTVFTTVLQQLAKSVVPASAVPYRRLFTCVLFAVLFGVLSHSLILDKDLCHPLYVSWSGLVFGNRCDEITATYLKLRDSC